MSEDSRMKYYYTFIGLMFWGSVVLLLWNGYSIFWALAVLYASVSITFTIEMLTNQFYKPIPLYKKLILGCCPLTVVSLRVRWWFLKHLDTEGKTTFESFKRAIQDASS